MVDRVGEETRDATVMETGPRASLELRKLALEVQELQRPWWQRPAYLSALFPLFIGILTVAVAWNRGLLEWTVKDLESRQADLNAEVARLNEEKVTLTENNEKLVSANKALETKEKTLIVKTRGLTGELQKTGRELAETRDRLELARLDDSLTRLFRAGPAYRPRQTGYKYPTIALKRTDERIEDLRRLLSITDAFQSKRIAHVQRQLVERKPDPLLELFIREVHFSASRDESQLASIFKLATDHAFERVADRRQFFAAPEATLYSPFLATVMEAPYPPVRKAEFLCGLQTLAETANELDVYRTSSGEQSIARKPTAETTASRLALLAELDKTVFQSCGDPRIRAILANRNLLFASVNALGAAQESWYRLLNLAPQPAWLFVMEYVRRGGSAQILEQAKEDMFSTPRKTEIACQFFEGCPLHYTVDLNSDSVAPWAARELQRHQAVAKLWLEDDLGTLRRNRSLLREFADGRWFRPGDLNSPATR